MSTTPTSRACSLRSRWARGALLALAVLAAAGCSKKSNAPASCTAGQSACTCKVDGSCDGGLTCVGGTCRTCVAGRASCACLSGGTCDGGLDCVGGTCSPCVLGTAGCGCDAGACDPGLACQTGTCAPASCTAGTLDCTCAAGDTCGDGLYCASGTTCRTCTNEVAGCACTGGICTGLICDTGTCRVAKTCDTIGCAPRQLCARGTVLSDATCLGSCEPGFSYDAATATCVAIPGSTCTPAVSGSIAAGCAAAQRTCVETATVAACGTCLTGFLEEERTCRAIKTCDDLGCAANHLSCTPAGAQADAVCGGCVDGYTLAGSSCVALTCADIAAQCTAANQVCETPAAGGAVCGACKTGFVADATSGACRVPYTCATLPVPCSGGLACAEGTATTDATCRDPACPPCTAEGEAGIWPDRTADGKCVCTTLPGYFYSLSGSVGTFRCDADGDGWVRDTARFALNSSDAALKTNARCTLRTVDRFVLHNDRGQVKTLTLAAPLPLYESVRNDDQARLDLVAGTPTVPVYGERTLRAAELNSLTKACAGEKADFNDNKLNDVAEWGRPPVDQAPVTASAELAADLVPLFEVYTRYSYFLELHHAWFEAGVAGQPGAYHVAEKDRTLAAGDGFPLRYGVEPTGVGTAVTYTSDVWQDCRRGRDAWYSELLPAATMDFASASPADRVWKGMTHHSQFKCVQIVDDLTYLNLGKAGRQQNRHVQTIFSLWEPGSYGPDVEDRDYLRAFVNVCRVSAGASLTPGGAGNPQEPVISCEAAIPAATHRGVLWAAVRISDSSRYYRGCIVQCAGSPYLCPGTPPGTAPLPCYSLCGDSAASEWKSMEVAPGGIRVRGGVPVIPLADRTLEDTTTGLRVQGR